MKDLPIACELTPTELEARRAGLLAGLISMSNESMKVTNGLRWRFAPSADFLTAVAKMIEAERQCCRFLNFVVTVEQNGGDMWLEVTGPEGTADFLEALIAGDIRTT